MGKISKPSELEALIARAANIQAEVEQLNTVDGALTGRAYVAAVASMPGADKKQADTISAAIDAGPPEGPTLAGAERRFIMALRQFRPSGPLKSSICRSTSTPQPTRAWRGLDARASRFTCMWRDG
jgi:hypothetical protein